MSALPPLLTPLPPTRPLLVLVLLIESLAPLPASAQPSRSTGEFTLYRCGPQGRELRNTPCPAEPGASRQLHFSPDDAEAASAARERARQESLLAERLRHEREARTQAELKALQQAPQGVLMNAAPPSPTASAPAPTPAPTASGAHRKARSAPPQPHRPPPRKDPVHGPAPRTPQPQKGARP